MRNSKNRYMPFPWRTTLREVFPHGKAKTCMNGVVSSGKELEAFLVDPNSFTGGSATARLNTKILSHILLKSVREKTWLLLLPIPVRYPWEQPPKGLPRSLPLTLGDSVAAKPFGALAFVCWHSTVLYLTSRSTLTRASLSGAAQLARHAQALQFFA